MGYEGVEAKLASLCAQAVDAIRGGHNILIISDRRMDREHVAIPAALALSAVHQHLVREGLRTTAGLVVETGSAREVHHFSVLAGYGAEAVHPYLALETLQSLHQSLPSDLAVEKAIYNYIKAIGKGLSKIMSKMGVSTYMSYCGAQLFEAIGLEKRWSRSISAALRVRSAASMYSTWRKRRSGCTAARSATIRCSPACSMRAASTPGGCAAKNTCGRRMRSRSSSTALAPTASRPTRNTRRSSMTSRTG
jgi:glutamate synthase domain-containing protein 2